MSQAVLELTNASIFQKENLILDDVSIRIEKGEFVYLIGTVSYTHLTLPTIYSV